MIGFGELRKLSLQWQTDIATVERVYALDWLLKGIFSRPLLYPSLALKDSAALSKAFLPDYPQAEEADFVLDARLSKETLQAELSQAAQDAANRTGMQFRLESMVGAGARFEYTGPLGRRSAAQPHLPLRFYATPPRSPIVERPLLHPFSDEAGAMVWAMSLNELAAERLALLNSRPRSRDVYDLWFILAHAGDQLDRDETRRLAEQIAGEKGRAFSPELDPAYRPRLEQAWENALKKLPRRPGFLAADLEIHRLVQSLFFA
ncbi:MAG: nucleotidyl transferase AbiEii/AbiGii toxin family protein [Anaerolineae bacterium]